MRAHGQASANVIPCTGWRHASARTIPKASKKIDKGSKKGNRRIDRLRLMREDDAEGAREKKQ